MNTDSNARQPMYNAKKIRQNYTRIYIITTMLCLTLVALAAMTFLYLSRDVYQNDDSIVANPPYNGQNDDNGEIDDNDPTTGRVTQVDRANSYVGRGPLLLINEDNPFDPRGAQNIIPMTGNAAITFNRNDHSLNRYAMEALDALSLAFRQQFPGEIIMIVLQSYTGIDFENHENDRTSGLTVGMQFWNTATQVGFHFNHGAMQERYNWVVENAPHFGLIQRFPPHRSGATGVSYNLPGHFRYVGIPHALHISHNNLVLEEYISQLRNYHNFNSRLVIEHDDQSWEVYFVPAFNGTSTSIHVPVDAMYDISGNNVDGFIVTIAN